MSQVMEHGSTDDRWYFSIRIIGDRNDVALAEKDLAGAFGSYWNNHSIATEPDGVTCHVWSSWGNEELADQVEDVFHAYPTLIFLMTFWDSSDDVRWNVARAYGFDAEVTAGEYEPSGGTPYEETQLFRDIFGRYLDLLTRPTPAQVQAEFGAKTERFRAMRERRLENESASNVPGAKRKQKRKPPR